MAFDLSLLEEKIEPVVLSHSPVDANGDFEMKDGELVVIKKEHQPRPIDAIGYQLLSKLQTEADNVENYRKLVRRILPTASDIEIGQMTPSQIYLLIGHVQKRLDEVIDKIKKVKAQAV